MKQQVTEVEQKVVTNSNLLFYLSDPDNDLLNLKLRKRAQALGNYFTNRLGDRFLSCFSVHAGNFLINNINAFLTGLVYIP